jgi:hypothetical protein
MNTNFRHSPTEFTKDNLVNLDKLATYLESLPADYEHFNMSFYFKRYGASKSLEQITEQFNLNQCGTSACAIGHGPAAGIPIQNDLLWTTYSTRAFGCTDWTHGFGQYMFNFENEGDHFDAAGRIREVLAYVKEVKNV